MNTFFQDELINSMLLKRMHREIKKAQLESAIKELNYINEIQSQVISRCDFTPSQNEELEYIKKINNARRIQNLQA